MQMQPSPDVRDAPGQMNRHTKSDRVSLFQNSQKTVELLLI
jgi:hypothetical protein